MNIAIIGNQWGDEGKGRVVHEFSVDYDWVIRYNGGANAGHTIYRDGVKFVHNLLPSTDYRHSRIRSYLGAGMVIDLEKLLQEVSVADKHFPGVGKSIYVDKDAFIVQEKHKIEDKAQNSHIGSTNRGIGPAYKDKIGRSGIRIRDILSHKVHPEEYGNLIADLYSLCSLGVQFVSSMELESDFKNSNLLFEGSQGVMLDINHGCYPYVSSSDCCPSGIIANGFGFAKLDKVYGVSKAYLTKVGEGPFPTEYFGKEAEDLRQRGNEYGATTGRPRRVGCMDLPALNYACKKGGVTDLIITKFDILSNSGDVNICARYEQEPTCSSDFFDAKPIYSKVRGWTNPKDEDQLDPYISLVEESVNRPVSYISYGTNPEDLVKWRYR